MLSRESGSLAAGLGILEQLAAAPEGLSATELARALALDKAYTYRLARSLERRGYLEQLSSTKAFRVTGQLVGLTGQLLRNLDVLGVSRPLMRELAHSTGEAVHLARRVPSGGGVYVAQERPGVQQISVETEIGARPPLHCTATGKALIVDADEEELRRLLSEPFQQHTWRTVITFEALCRNLAETRERGYAIDDEEFQADVRCVAAPISDLMGRTVACVGISGPTTRITLRHLSELGELVANAAARISARLGLADGARSGVGAAGRAGDVVPPRDGQSRVHQETPMASNAIGART